MIRTGPKRLLWRLYSRCLLFAFLPDASLLLVFSSAQVGAFFRHRLTIVNLALS